METFHHQTYLVQNSSKKFFPPFKRNVCHAIESLTKLNMDESKKPKGKLILNTPNGLKKSVIPNNPEQSPLFKRVTLEKEDDDFMPPQGKEDPLTKNELKILETGYKAGPKQEPGKELI